MISKVRNPVQWHRLEKRRDAVKRERDQLRALIRGRDLDEGGIKKELKKRTGEFRERLTGDETEEDLLPEAFAVVCIAFEYLWPFPKTGDKVTEKTTGAEKNRGISLNDEQIMGGIALHDGRIIEMKTGEGKTFTAVLPLYLNALSNNKRCILVTTNEYLARRDANDLYPLYDSLGLTAVCGVPEEGSTFTSIEKEEIYKADIVYTTQKVLTGDYLYDNRRSAQEKSYLQEMNYCIVDEADAVLLDNASVPHIISGAPRPASQLAGTADYLVSMMKGVRKESGKEEEGGDYEVDGESVWLTEKGIRRTEEFFGIDDLYAPGHEEIVRTVTLALRAHAILEQEKRYIVEDHRIVLLDVREGRPLPDNMLQSGQHQALEAKENVPISPQRRSMASITFQSYFSMYPRLAGMTGTGASDEDEFRSIYGLEVVRIPTTQKVVRKDQRIRIYPCQDAMIDAAMADIFATHRTGQPVLVVAGSIAISRKIDDKLWEESVLHNLLTAKNLAKEAQIISEAGKKGAVTVATSVAGRGTDIKLGKNNGENLGKDDIENLRQHTNRLFSQATNVRNKRSLLRKDPEATVQKVRDLKQLSRRIEEDVENLENADVRELGGLAVIIVGMTRNRRTELQARGRSGRRGDPGRSAFYASLEDDVVTENRPDWLKRYMKPGRKRPRKQMICENSPDWRKRRRKRNVIDDEMLKNVFIYYAVMGTRRAAEAKERDLRRQMRSVEDTVRQQREIIYDLRNRVLKDMPEDPELQKEFCNNLAAKDPDKAVQAAIEEKLREIHSVLENASRQNIVGYRGDGELTEEQRDRMNKDVNRCMAIYLRTMTLKAIDDAWVEQVDYLQQLREIVSGRRSAGRNMQREFNREANEAYNLMAEEIERAALYNILSGTATQGVGGKVEFRSLL